MSSIAQSSFSPPAPLSLERVPFHGDTLEAVEHDGRILVSLRRACECLGLDYSAQRKRISDKDRCPWATVVMTATVALDGKDREQVLIDIDTLPIWLATVEASRVDESIREKLKTYQCECARVLRDHFLPARKGVEMPLAGDDKACDGITAEEESSLREVQSLIRTMQLVYETKVRLVAVNQEQRRIARQQEALSIRQDELAGQQKALAAHMLERTEAIAEQATEAHERIDSREGKMSVVGFLRIMGVKRTDKSCGSYGSAITRMADRLGRGDEIQSIHSEAFGRINIYSPALLCLYFDGKDVADTKGKITTIRASDYASKIRESRDRPYAF